MPRQLTLAIVVASLALSTVVATDPPRFESDSMPLEHDSGWLVIDIARPSGFSTWLGIETAAGHFASFVGITKLESSDPTLCRAGFVTDARPTRASLRHEAVTPPLGLAGAGAFMNLADDETSARVLVAYSVDAPPPVLKVSDIVWGEHPDRSTISIVASGPADAHADHDALLAVRGPANVAVAYDHMEVDPAAGHDSVVIALSAATDAEYRRLEVEGDGQTRVREHGPAVREEGETINIPEWRAVGLVAEGPAALTTTLVSSGGYWSNFAFEMPEGLFPRGFVDETPWVIDRYDPRYHCGFE